MNGKKARMLRIIAKGHSLQNEDYAGKAHLIYKQLKKDYKAGVR